MIEVWERFTENSRRIVFFAQEEAVKSGAGEVAPEHFLLALLRDRRAFPARIVAQMVSDLDLICAELGTGVVDSMRERPLQLSLSEFGNRAVAIARDEARRQDCKHVGPEHLLLGVVGEGTGTAGRVLAQYGIDVERTRAAISKLRSSQFASASSGPAGGSRAVKMPAVRAPARFTERARQILVLAREEARRFQADSVATEHLLLGLVRDADTVAVQCLDRLRVPLPSLRAEIQRQIIEARLQPALDAPAAATPRTRLERLGVNLDAIHAGIQRQVAQAKGNAVADMELSPASKTAIDLACDEADRLAHNFVGTEHLLLGLIREETGLAARALLLAGVDLDQSRDAILAMQSEARARLLDDNPAERAANRQEKNDVRKVPGDIDRMMPAEDPAVPGDLGVAQTTADRSSVEVSSDLITFARLAAVLATKDAHGYRALAGLENAIFLIPDITPLKLLLPPVEADIRHKDACYVRVLSGEFEGRAGWIARRSFRWTGQDVADFLPELLITDRDPEAELPAE